MDSVISLGVHLRSLEEREFDEFYNATKQSIPYCEAICWYFAQKMKTTRSMDEIHATKNEMEKLQRMVQQIKKNSQQNAVIVAGTIDDDDNDCGIRGLDSEDDGSDCGSDRGSNRGSNRGTDMADMVIKRVQNIQDIPGALLCYILTFCACTLSVRFRGTSRFICASLTQCVEEMISRDFLLLYADSLQQFRVDTWYFIRNIQEIDLGWLGNWTKSYLGKSFRTSVASAQEIVDVDKKHRKHKISYHSILPSSIRRLSMCAAGLSQEAFDTFLTEEFAKFECLKNLKSLEIRNGEYEWNIFDRIIKLAPNIRYFAYPMKLFPEYFPLMGCEWNRETVGLTAISRERRDVISKSMRSFHQGDGMRSTITFLNCPFIEEICLGENVCDLSDIAPMPNLQRICVRLDFGKYDEILPLLNILRTPSIQFIHFVAFDNDSLCAILRVYRDIFAVKTTKQLQRAINQYNEVFSEQFVLSDVVPNPLKQLKIRIDLLFFPVMDGNQFVEVMKGIIDAVIDGASQGFYGKFMFIFYSNTCIYKHTNKEIRKLFQNLPVIYQKYAVQSEMSQSNSCSMVISDRSFNGGYSEKWYWRPSGCWCHQLPLDADKIVMTQNAPLFPHEMEDNDNDDDDDDDDDRWGCTERKTAN